MSKSKRYSEEIIVTEAHLDQLNHVNNVEYLKWVQMVAEHHWRSAAPLEIQEAYIWVVLSHHIVYKRQSFLGDKLTLNTYVESFEGVKSNRIVEIMKGDLQVVQAKTEWCMLDAAQMRPKRVTEDIVQYFFEP